MDCIRIGVDIAKSVFHVHGVNKRGQTCWSGKYNRHRWLEEVEKRVAKGAIVSMEACASAHHWARELQQRGYDVKLIAAQFVKPYVKSNKNDQVDAEAICEAASRPNMRFVTVKTVSQQNNQAMHRIREELVCQRTAKANQIRGLVGEYGVIAPLGIQKLRQALPVWLENGNHQFTDEFRYLLTGLYEDLQHLDDRISEVDKRIKELVNNDPVAQRLMQLRGIGPLAANILASILTNNQHKRGRDFAASLGLVPKQHSTGGRQRLLGISKRGDGYLRKLLIHGARAVLRYSGARTDDLSRWLQGLSCRKHANVVAVALANKTARAAWAIVSNEVEYNPALMTQAG